MSNELKERVRRFALAVISFTESLPRDETSRVISRQLLRAGTSVGANYRSATRAKSAADFISKMSWVEEEADECGYWIDLLVGAGKVDAAQVDSLLREANELVAIAVASIKTARRNAGKANPVSTRAKGQSVQPTDGSRTTSGAPVPQSAIRNPHSP